MPLYDFQCQNCGKIFEVRRMFSQADDPGTCPSCQGSAQRLMPTSFSVFSKSWSGWVTRVQGTDSPWRTEKKGSPRAAQESPAESSSASSSDSSVTSE